MASLGFRHVDNGTHGRVSVGTATLQSVAGIVIYISMVIAISTEGFFPDGLPRGGG